MVPVANFLFAVQKLFPPPRACNMSIYIHKKFYNLIHLNSFKYRSSTFIVHKAFRYNSSEIWSKKGSLFRQVHLRCIHTINWLIHWKMSQLQGADSLGKRRCLCSKWNNHESHINAALNIIIFSLVTSRNVKPFKPPFKSFIQVWLIWCSMSDIHCSLVRYQQLLFAWNC